MFYRRLQYLLIVLCLLGLGSRGAWGQPQNVILFIGDGMGFEQIDAARLYALGPGGTFGFEMFPFFGEVATASADSAITDSAAAASAMATGHKVSNGVISKAIPGNEDDLLTVLEFFAAQGKRTGLVSTAFITHATPAGFGAHASDRTQVAEIAADYLTGSRPNLLFGGGGEGMSPEAAASAGYQVVTDVFEMVDLAPPYPSYLSGQFGTTHLPYVYDGQGSLPTLSAMTAKALQVLENEGDGFFLMVEGGRIDHAGHANDLIRNIYETIAFADAVDIAVQWALTHNDTLIVVTADHETGGLTVTGDNGLGHLPDATWSTTGHTAQHVPIYAVGVNAQLVSGVLENTFLFDILTFSQVPCGDDPIRIDRLSPIQCTDLQTCYDAEALDTDVIKIQALEFSGDLYFDAPLAVQLSGGYGCGFWGNPALTVFSGTMTISDGTITAESITLQ